MQPTDKIWRNGSFVSWEDAQVHVLTHALHYGTGRLRGHPRLRDAQGLGRVPADRPPRAPAPLGRALRDGPRLHRARAGRGRARDGGGERRALLLRAPDRLPRRRADGPLPAATTRSRWRSPCGRGAPTWARRRSSTGVRCKISSFRRIGPNTLPPAAKATGQYINSVLAKLEAIAGRLRRGHPAERGGLRGRRLGRERVRRPRRRAVHAAHHRLVPARHHPRDRDPDRHRARASRCAR